MNQINDSNLSVFFFQVTLLSTDKLKGKSPNHGYYSQLTAWMDLKWVKISQYQKVTYCMIPLTQSYRDKRTDSWLPREGWGTVRMVFTYIGKAWRKFLWWWTGLDLHCSGGYTIYTCDNIALNHMCTHACAPRNACKPCEIWVSSVTCTNFSFMALITRVR